MDYEKKIEIIKKLIEKTFPDIDPEYIYKPNSEYFDIMFKCLDGSSVATSFIIDSKWVNTKKIIEEIIKYPTSPEPDICLICYEYIVSQEIFCRICRFIQCIDCFNKILCQNRGIHICPKCRHTFDRRFGKIDDNTLTCTYYDSDNESDYEAYYLQYVDSGSLSGIDDDRVIYYLPYPDSDPDYYYY